MTEHSDADEPAVENATDEPDEAALEAFDLDDDGRISVIENARAELGILDAQAEQDAEDPGIKGKVAKAAHRILDKLDND